MKDSDSPILAYQAMIDQLASETTRSVSSDIVKTGLFLETSDDAPYNELLTSLTASQREILSRALLAERSDAIHDVLAVLTWWIECRDVSLTFKGQPMPVDLSGMGLHGDFVGRRSDWDWPVGAS